MCPNTIRIISENLSNPMALDSEELIDIVLGKNLVD
jgi:hypothetical protein